MIGETMGSTGKGVIVAVCLILITQAAASRALSVAEQDIPKPDFRRLPMQLDKWTASIEESLDPDTLHALSPDDYILRDYVADAGGPPVNVFAAYFKSLQNTYGPHSPRVCLPGSGWLVRSSKIGSVEIPGRGEAIPINEVVMEKADDRILVLYWYQNDRNVWAEEYRAKLTLLPDLLRHRRSDVSLVRLVMPVHGDRWDGTLATGLTFAKALFPEVTARFASAAQLLSEQTASHTPGSSN